MIYLAIVNACLDGADAETLATAFFEREQTATVWINPAPRTSRVVFDVEGDEETAVQDRALALVDAVAEACGASAADTSVTVTTDRARLQQAAEAGLTDPAA